MNTAHNIIFFVNQIQNYTNMIIKHYQVSYIPEMQRQFPYVYQWKYSLE